MVVPELLEVGEVAGPGPVAERDDQTRLVAVPADAGGGLDVLGGVLRLTDHEHQAEPGDVDADLEHRGGEDARRRAPPRGRVGLPACRSAASARLPAVESNTGSNGTAIWSRVPVMSALATREVSSATCSAP